MKKILALLLVAVMCLSIAACGESSTPESTETNNSIQSNPEISDSSDDEWLLGTWYQLIDDATPSAGCYYCLKIEFNEDGTYIAKTVIFHADETDNRHNSIVNATQRGSMQDCPEEGWYSRSGNYTIEDSQITLECGSRKKSNTTKIDDADITLTYELAENGFPALSFLSDSGEEIVLQK